MHVLLELARLQSSGPLAACSSVGAGEPCTEFYALLIAIAVMQAHFIAPGGFQLCVKGTLQLALLAAPTWQKQQHYQLP